MCPCSHFGWLEYFGGPRLLLVMADEFSVSVVKITSEVNVSWTHSLFFCFLTNEMVVLSKVCKPDNRESHNYLSLSFTIIWSLLQSTFVGCEFFCESKSPDLSALCEADMEDSIDSSIFLFEGLSSIKWKGIKYLYAWSCSLCEGGTSFCTRLFSKKLRRFLFLTGFTLFYILLFFSYGLLSLSLYTVFVTISNIDEVISINPSANVLVLGDFNIHYKDWLTYYGGTYRPGELCHYFFQHRWLAFLLVSLTLILSLALLDLFISYDPNTYSAVALGMTLKVWWVFLLYKIHFWLVRLIWERQMFVITTKNNKYLQYINKYQQYILTFWNKT